MPSPNCSGDVSDVGAFSSKSCGLHFYAQFTGGQNLKNHQQSLFKTDHSTKGRPQLQMRTAKPPPNQLHHRPSHRLSTVHRLCLSCVPSASRLTQHKSANERSEKCPRSVLWRGLTPTQHLTQPSLSAPRERDTNENIKLCFPKLKAKTEQ